MAELQALRVDPDLDCSPPRKPTAPPPPPPAAAAAAQWVTQPTEREERLPATRPKSLILQRKRASENRLSEEEEDYADVPETPLFDNKDEEEELMMRRTPQMKRKRPLTRLTVKREERNITAPMIEVSGPDGPMMVFRPWTALEAREAMAHLPDVSEGGDRLSTELLRFCEEFSQTMTELRRLLLSKLGPSNWYKISNRMPVDDHRRKSSDWNDDGNDGYRRAVGTVARVIKETFPTRVNMSKISRCRQEKDETVDDYYCRLHDVFNKFSGLTEPANRGLEPDTRESHLRNAFMDGLKPEITEKVKASCIEWREGRLATVLIHARHADELLREKREKKLAKSDSDLRLSLSKIALGAARYEPRQERRENGGRRRSEKGQAKDKRYSRKWSCWVCETDDHNMRDCSKCCVCKKDRHWAKHCPEAKKEDKEGGEGEKTCFYVSMSDLEGATRSTVRPCDLPCKPELTDHVSESICASGRTMYERVEEEGSEQWSCLHEEPQWVYEWHIMNYDWAEMVCRKTREIVTSSGVEIMAPDELHCTSHVALQRDENYEKDWFGEDETETLSFDKMFWTDSVCALSACLTEAQSRQYQMTEQTVPHLSLSKARGQKWSEVGLFVKQCVDAGDWRETGPDLQHSESLKAFMMTLKCEVEVERVVKPILHEQTDWENQCMVNAGPSDIHPALAEVPSRVWAKHKYDVGLIKGCEPLVMTPKSDYRPCQHQYPLKKEAIEGIRPVFESLLREGAIVPCSDSPVRTPIFPVKKIRDKGQPTEWRFVQDLQAVNAATRQRAPSVPNPYTILSQIPSDAKFFSVVDLANAFFSVPVAKDSQYWFAFEFDGKGYCFQRMAQGFAESPTKYNEALKRSLEPLKLSEGTALLHYVDDLCVASRDEATCVADTVTLLKHLAEEGHKVSLSKLQFAKQQVIFLRHVITPNSKSLSDKRIQGIKDVPKPVTRKQMLSFLGMCSYCRTFIPNYAILEQPLRSLTVGKGLKSTDKIEWTAEAEEAFVNIKIQLAQAPALGLPNGDRPFVQMVDEKNGFMTSVLLQHHGDRLRPVAYFSSKLDPVAAGLPLCLRVVAAAEQAVIASREFVGYSDLTLMAPHAVTMILQEQKTSHLSTARWLRYHTILLDMPNITIKRCTTLNAATHLPTEGDGEEHHCCLTSLEQICTPRPDLSDMPLENCDSVLFVDGSASKDPQTGQNKVGYAITTEFEIVASGKLPSNYSAQAAELVALTEACKLMKDKCVTIYTDSRYAFGVTHDFGALWKHRKFLKSDGRPILNAHLVAELLEAILLPKKIAICKCAAHTNQKDSVSLGNARADAAAKTAAAQRTEEPECTLLSDTNENSFSSLQGMQTFATGPEKEQWRKCGCKVTDGVWMSEDGRPCLPKHFFSHYCRLTHGRHRRDPLNICKWTLYCLVMVDMWSKWTEVFPSSKQDATAVAKALLTEIVPRWGIPRKISSDNEGIFGGGVERHNQTLKNKLAKCCEETGLTWVKALPIVLMYMRMRKRVRSNLSPYEILFGRPPHVGLEGGKQPLPSTELCEHDMLSYCKEMSSLLSNICVQVKAAQQKVAETPLHAFKPGDFVVIRDFRRKSWRAKRWLGPFQVLLTTHTAVKVAERATKGSGSKLKITARSSQEKNVNTRHVSVGASTENALTLVNGEMKELRDAVIQNRLVLDMLTSKSGGVCKMLGTSCCFHIPDYSDNVTNIVAHMRMAIKEPEKTNTMQMEWWTTLWGGWGYWICTTVLPMIGAGLLLLLCLPCILQFISSSVQRLVASSVSPKMVKLHVGNENVMIGFDLEKTIDDDSSSGTYSEMN
ncbi:hypothetical protein M9458_054243 [Cirrhinus mrigala]|uniref:ribonuclease H n=1 Tax=Cirrhinus mrigala TaxID=683832 RepID=A0ABD0MP84_CIRMR